MNTIGVLLAVSTLFAARPSATDSQVSARVSSNSTPTTASHSTNPAVGANPMSSVDTRDDGRARTRSG